MERRKNSVLARMLGCTAGGYLQGLLCLATPLFPAAMSRYFYPFSQVIRNPWLPLTPLVFLTAVLRSQAQVQSNVGYSQQVLPSKFKEVTRLSQDTVRNKIIQDSLRKRVETFIKANPNKANKWLRTSQVGAERVHKYGVLTDGDFSKAVVKDGASPTTGSIGFNYTRLLPVTYGRNYLLPSIDASQPKSTRIDTVFIQDPERLETDFSFNLTFSLGSRGDTLLLSRIL